MSKLITKTVQDVPIPVYIDVSKLWVGADDIFKVLHVQPFIIGIPPQHRQYWYDFKNYNKLEGNKLFVDLYGLSVICHKSNNPLASYLLTQFVGDVYADYYLNQPVSSSPNGSSNNNNCSTCKPIDNNVEIASEKISKQYELILNTLNQLCVNNNGQFAEFNNQVSAVRLQNNTISSQINAVHDVMSNKLVSDIEKLSSQTALGQQQTLQAVNTNDSLLKQVLKNENTNTNSILSNLASSVTNMTTTLGNLGHNVTNTLETIKSEISHANSNKQVT